jgi:hypothetical protein
MKKEKILNGEISIDTLYGTIKKHVFASLPNIDNSELLQSYVKHTFNTLSAIIVDEFQNLKREAKND